MYVSTDICIHVYFYCAYAPNQSSLEFTASLVFIQYVYQDIFEFLNRNEYFQCFWKGSNLFPLFKPDVCDRCSLMLMGGLSY